MEIHFFQHPEPYMQDTDLIVSSTASDHCFENYIHLGSVDVKEPQKLEGKELQTAAYNIAIGLARREVGTKVKELAEAQEVLDRLMAIEAPKDDIGDLSINEPAYIHEDDIPF
jgi:hypothetical protein